MAISNSRRRAEPLKDPDPVPPNRKHRLHFGRFSVPIPSSRPLRIIVGLALCLGGLLWFLPILGLWMLPLGLLMLSIDLAPVRRLRRRLEIWWGRRQQKKRGS
jgi:hypothetical protein